MRAVPEDPGTIVFSDLQTVVIAADGEEADALYPCGDHEQEEGEDPLLTTVRLYSLHYNPDLYDLAPEVKGQMDHSSPVHVSDQQCVRSTVAWYLDEMILYPIAVRWGKYLMGLSPNYHRDRVDEKENHH